MEDKVTIQKENLLKAYNQSSEEQKALLENIFGKDMFQPKDVKERVKSLDDAIKELGEDHQYVKAYRGWMRISNTECKDVTAYIIRGSLSAQKMNAIILMRVVMIIVLPLCRQTTMRARVAVSCLAVRISCPRSRAAECGWH